MPVTTHGKVQRGHMCMLEFNSVTLFTILYSRFLNCAKDVSKVTAQPTILESIIKSSVIYYWGAKELN